MTRGLANSVIMKERMQQKVRDGIKAPPIDVLMKERQEQNYGVWERYLLK